MSQRDLGPLTTTQRARTIACLRKHGVRTTRQVQGANGSWRAIMDLVAAGHVVQVGSNDRAQVLYALAGEAA